MILIKENKNCLAIVCFHRKLDNNSLTCSNCRMKGFRDFLRNHTYLGNQPTKCGDIKIINHNFTDCTGRDNI